MQELRNSTMNAEDDVPQAERRRIMADERRRQTYHGHALDSEPELGGRFAKVQMTTVVGTGPISYPKQPAGSPWAKDECPPEPQLGYSVEEREPVCERASTSAAPGAKEPPSPLEKSGGGVRSRFRRRA
jgi:hypothetical protein